MVAYTAHAGDRYECRRGRERPPPLSSKLHHTRLNTFPMMQCKQCLIAHRPARVLQQCLWTSSGLRLPTTCWPTESPFTRPLTLLKFTQRGNGKQHAHEFSIITERVQDPTACSATELTHQNCYATVALCTVEKVTDFTTAKGATAIAIISKVVPPSKPQQHAVDVYIEAMEVILEQNIPRAMEMMHQLTRISNTQSANPAISSEVAWQQRKCRRLLRYPTLAESCPASV